MVQHLSERGEPFVKDGKLIPHRSNVLYSPNCPRTTENQSTTAKQKPKQE